MRLSETKLIGRPWFWPAVVAAAVLVSANGWGQDTKSAAPEATPSAAADANASADDTAAKADEKSAAPDAAATTTTPPTVAPPATETVPAAKPGESEPAPGGTATVQETPTGAVRDAGTTDEPPAERSTAMPAGKTQDSVAENVAQAAGAPEKGGWSVWTLAITLLALFVLPIMAGNYLASAWKMPDHAWKISLTLGVLAGSLVVCYFGKFKAGPDLAGGITLIYELQDAPTEVVEDTNQGQTTGLDADRQLRSGGREFSLNELITSLKRRLDPDGTKEITIRAYGQAVEIIIPEVGQDEMEFVKQVITEMGQLEFRITADPTMQKDKIKIDLAKVAPPTQKDINQGDELVARWVPYDERAFGPVDQAEGYVKRMAGDTPEILVLIDPMNVTGEFLTSATKGLDEQGGLAVHFSFDGQGAAKFEKLTSQNLPNQATANVYRHLGILLDNKLVNAPTINSTISDRGQISGGSMTDREVDLYVQVLNAGSLPAALNKTPISQEVISPTLGGQTIEQGTRSIIAALIGVVLFMIVYYRFAGVVACIALTLNLLMVLALMVLIKAAFTLPGLAGLALTVGMSVDANVLIYERIREELENGAALRMAIRNGFSRAMSAIIDSNLTVIISGIVLFYIGTDQVKGFAVTLVLGIITSMFSATFVARLIFDVAERQGWIKNLRMMHIFSKPNFDFLSLRWPALIASWVLIAVGMVAVYFRGSQLLDIDFTGGSSVAFTLNEANKMTLGEVRDALLKTDLAEKNLVVVERGITNTSYSLDTSEQSVDNVKELISKEFGNKLKRYSVAFSDLKPVTSSGIAGSEAKLVINSGPGHEDEGGVSHDALKDQIRTALEQLGHPGIQPKLTHPDYQPGSSVRYKEWTVQLPGLDQTAAQAVLENLQASMQATPLFPLANSIGGRVSSDMKFQAMYAIAISLVAMIVYLWLRFHKPAYGLAAGVALIHDVLVTIGMIALSFYIVEAVPGLASVLRIDAFQINLTIVAALLTIIGFSVNDTIVTFDRLREIKGKTPVLTADMVNMAVNQTLSRTFLTVFNVFIVIVILYFFGGAGLHSFAYAFLVGIIVGTYSSVYIAAPVLLWLSGVSAAPVPKAEASTRGMQPARQ